MKFVVFLLLLAALTGVAVWGYTQQGEGFLRAVFTDEKEAVPRAEWAPPSISAAPVIVSDKVMPWIRDERWSRGVEAGEQGLALIELAYHEHYEVQGDPFLFRARKDEAARLLNAAIADLTALRESYASNPTACLDVDPPLRKYQAGLAKTPRR